ncbi:thioredoxin domain-containing protein [Candidatus Marinimicrobia bacterium]|nr:thioredoxin domain-containing protein [Candidatus Neomarinimicrobiota bacterium]
MAKKLKVSNRLKNSQSLYLLQHASNPVNWYPWCDEAFDLAKKENKPIFLSIGYSTCHWCHVMEKESFEDPIVAKNMNSTFINIKVDREEMPEIDHLYMSVCQAMTGHGGWPLTIVMSPNKEPFFSGTYFPKNAKRGNPGLLQLIPSLKNAWIYKQDEIHDSIRKIEKYLIKINSSLRGKNWDENIIHSAANQLQNRFDHENGGFGGAPKFPSAHNLIFLIKYSSIYNNSEILSMVEKTLQQMRLGGIFDHIGLGFHRYSTDKKWFLPHFEKMLYDQAMNSMAYIEAYHITKNEEYAEIAEEVFSYVLRDMKHEKGGFFSAEDADSEGEEGTFYIWTEQELFKILGEKDGSIISKIYGFSKTGNFLDEASGKRNGGNIPYLSESKSVLAKKINVNLDELNKIIEFSRKNLFEKRKKRIHPLKDDKILTDWNGLMIASLAQGGIVLDNERYIREAIYAADFIQEYLQRNDGRLVKRYRQGHSGLDPHINDYSFMIWGLINLYEATFKTIYLSRASKLTEVMIEDFYDENGGFFIGSKNAEKLIIRAKDYYDGAIPSGNSAAIYCLFKLGKITGNRNWINIAHESLKAFSNQANSNPTGFTYMLTGLMFDLKSCKELIIVIDKNKHDIRSILKKIKKEYYPNFITIVKDINDKDLVENIAPWIDSYMVINDKPSYFVCTNFSCKQPTNNIKKALRLLNE